MRARKCQIRTHEISQKLHKLSWIYHQGFSTSAHWLWLSFPTYDVSRKVTGIVRWAWGSNELLYLNKAWKHRKDFYKIPATQELVCTLYSKRSNVRNHFDFSMTMGTTAFYFFFCFIEVWLINKKYIRCKMFFIYICIYTVKW